MKFIIQIAFLIGTTVWLVVIYFLIQAYLWGIRSKSWPHVQGKVVTSQIKALHPDATGRLNISYRELFKYEYEVADHTYVSNRVSFGDEMVLRFSGRVRSKRAAQHLIQKYPEGTTIDVYYQPDNPRLSTVNSGISDVNLIIITILTIVVGVVIFKVFALWM